MNDQIDFREKIRQIERLLRKNEYTDSATRCVLVIEQAFRQVLSRYLEHVDEDVRRRVHDAAPKRNTRGEGIERLTMGQLVHVFRKSHVLEAVARDLGKDLSSLHIIDLEKLAALRNRFAHQDQQASRMEATFLLNCLNIILDTFELLNTQSSLDKTGDATARLTHKRPPLSDTFEHGYALLIGVGNTAHYPKWSLPVTVNDVQALHALLTNADICAYPNDDRHIRVLHDAHATHEAILDGLNWLKTQTAADPEATVIVYYSGHGWVDTATGHYYLIPGDIDPVDFPDSALSADVFTNALREIAAQRLVVFVDSCHAEAMATSKEIIEIKLPSGFAKTALPERIVNELKQGQGRVVFTSSRGEQSSYVRPDETMSIYTYHLIEALQGADNHPGDTVVRVSNLMTHLGKTVPESARTCWQKEQTPFFDATTEDFPIALLYGGKGLPAHEGDAVHRDTREIENKPKTTETTVIHQQAGDNAVQIGHAHDVTIRQKRT